MRSLARQAENGRGGDDRGGAAPLAVRRRRARRATTACRGFREAPRLPHWVNCGLYVLGEEALERLPERGDHETTTFPELAAEGRLARFRHEGVWLTVNTPKDLRAAEEHLAVRGGVVTELSPQPPRPRPVPLGGPRRSRSRGATRSSSRSRTGTAARSSSSAQGSSSACSSTARKDETSTSTPAGSSSRSATRPGRSSIRRSSGRATRSASSPASVHRWRALEDTRHPRGLDAGARRRRAPRGPLRARRRARVVARGYRAGA